MVLTLMQRRTSPRNSMIRLVVEILIVVAIVGVVVAVVVVGAPVNDSSNFKCPKVVKFRVA